MSRRRPFQFRQFSVADDQCSMKVGTDAVLLAAWATVDNATAILDIGTGCGVIALIAAQRTPSTCIIHGVDIQQPEVMQARSNVQRSPWSPRVEIFHNSIQEYNPPTRYDVILCNPPYFINSLRPPDGGRATARHTTTMDHAALISAMDRLLSTDGTFHTIMPLIESEQFITAMAGAFYHCIRRDLFKTRPTKAPERSLMTFSRNSRLNGRSEGEIVLYDENDNWSAAYTSLTKELYLPHATRATSWHGNGSAHTRVD